jgi:biopolymer transport protein ExbB
MKKQIKLVFTFTFILLSVIAVAQEAVKVPAKNTSTDISAFEFLMKGGVWLIPIGLLLFYSLVVIVEKFRYIRKMTKYNTSLLADLKDDLLATNYDAVLKVLAKDKTAFGSVVNEGVQSMDRGYVERQSNMEKAANIEIGKMEKNLGHLGLIAGIAPTLGFIGTISGVIKIFYSISITENVSIGNISGGLYEKMISSGSGLVVGIIAFAGYHLLNGMIDNYALNIQKVSLDFANLLRQNNGNQTK